MYYHYTNLANNLLGSLPACLRQVNITTILYPLSYQTEAL